MFQALSARRAISQSMFQAIEQGDVLALRSFLASNRALANTRDDRGRTPLHAAPTAEVARVLIEHGGRVKAIDLQGNTPLHATGNAEVAVVLIEHGASLDATNYAGQAPDETGHADVSRLIAMLREERAVEQCAKDEFQRGTQRGLVMG